MGIAEMIDCYFRRKELRRQIKRVLEEQHLTRQVMFEDYDGNMPMQLVCLSEIRRMEGELKSLKTSLKEPT